LISRKEATMRLSNKTVLITGGNSGIGLATARLFVAEGAKVAITGRNQETLDAAAKEIGPNLLAIRADVTQVVAIEKAVAEVVAKFGKLDVVFANAGIGGASPVGRTTLEGFEQIIRTNLTSVFFTVQAVSEHLNKGASIILNGSVHAVLGVPGWSAYAATKAGVRAMTRNLASEFAPQGIRVNQVTPGATRTPIWSPYADALGGIDALEQQLSRGIPLGHLSEADDLAKAALYLASDDAVNVTGAEIVVDGGATASPLGAPVYRAA
jgi:NAD(P)-dependent dehydrogenase (short-subunit alcohol dehydrogenase family)